MRNKSFSLVGIAILFLLVGAGCSANENTIIETSTEEKEVSQQNTDTQPMNDKIIEPIEVTTEVQKIEPSVQKPVETTPAPTPPVVLNTVVSCEHDADCFKKHIADCSNATHIYSTLILEYAAKIEDKGDKCNVNVIAKIYDDAQDDALSALEGTYYNCEFDKEVIKNDPDISYKKIFEDASTENCNGTYVDLMN
jgi:hypothetical protein